MRCLVWLRYLAIVLGIPVPGVGRPGQQSLSLSRPRARVACCRCLGVLPSMLSRPDFVLAEASP